MTGRLPTGVTLKRWGYQTTNVCPRCGLPEFKQIHVVQCSCPLAVRKWDSFLSSLDDWFVTSHTQPDICKGLLNHLQQWHDGTPGVPYRCLSTRAQLSFGAQQAIGWTPFFLGLMHPSWAVLQQDYYSELGKRNTGKRWITQLLCKFWTVSWDLWTHRRSILQLEDSYVLQEKLRC
jgi:hypothetical protein